MLSYKYTAIILKRTNLGEADRIVTAFSKEQGLVRFVAKGARRTKSKLAGPIELFCESNLIISKGKSLDILTNSEIAKNHLGLEPSLEELQLASFFAEIFIRLIPEGTPNLELYNLLSDCYGLITKGKIELLRMYFLLKFFELSGVFPETNHCVKCSEVLTGQPHFSKEAGGVLDEDCSAYFSDAEKICQNTIKIFRLAEKVNIETFINIKSPNLVIDESTKVLIDYLHYIFDRTFKSEMI